MQIHFGSGNNIGTQIINPGKPDKYNSDINGIIEFINKKLSSIKNEKRIVISACNFDSDTETQNIVSAVQSYLKQSSFRARYNDYLYNVNENDNYICLHPEPNGSRLQINNQYGIGIADESEEIEVWIYSRK